MLSKIKTLLSLFKVKPTVILNNPFKTEQQDTRDMETRRRVNDHFNKNMAYINTQAIMPHGYDCSDPVTCENVDCYKWQPDKIVGNPYKVNRALERI